jgi:hypothetical protein
MKVSRSTLQGELSGEVNALQPQLHLQRLGKKTERNKAHEKQISSEAVIYREETEVEYEDNRKASARSWHSGFRKS